jgi:hypothetical protein
MLAGLNLDQYKNLLLNKLKDSLEITGVSMDDLRLRLSHATAISIDNGKQMVAILQAKSIQ